MGETKMGEFQFSSWTLHMASIIIFSSIWGLALREWKGTSRFTKFILGFAIFTLLYSTIVVGYGNLMKAQAADKAEAAVEAVEGEAPVATEALEAETPEVPAE
jgi:L-rhamnose-H+ transport protein